MRYVILLILILFIVSTLPASIDFFTPRSLALGMGGFSFSYDFTALYNNPALLASFPFSVSGISYQNRYGDLIGMEKNLNGLLSEWRKITEEQVLSASGSEYLEALAEPGAAVFGFNAKVPAVLVKNLGMGAAIIQSAYMVPFISADAMPSPGSNEPVFHAVGLKYTQYSLAYAMPISKTMFLGAGAHLLSGKCGFGDYSISNPFFETEMDSEGVIKKLIESCDQKFSKIIFHFSFIWKLAETLDVSLSLENLGNPTLFKDENQGIDLEMTQKYRASFAFRPTQDWGFYGDADIRKTPVYPGISQDRQLVSFGVEKGFFQNTAFLRMGINTDISRKKILGENSAMVVSFGVGIRIGTILVDAGLIMNGNGTINGLAIAGYYVVN